MKKIRRLLWIIPLAFGFFVIYNPASNITGLTILNDISSNVRNILGFVFILAGVLAFLARKKEGGLVEKLFFKDERGVIRMHDFLGEISQEGIDPREPAKEILKDLKEKFKEPSLKELATDMLGDSYVPVAKKQRDSYAQYSIPENSEFEMADKFLKDWDEHYTKFVPTILREKTYKTHLNREQGTYDSREVVEVMEDNIEGFGVEDKKIGTHDVNISYQGTGSILTAGSGTPYETDSNAINARLRRFVEIDVSNGTIKEEDSEQRLNVLKAAIYG